MTLSQVPKSTPPNASSRKKCWAARDVYFSCLDQHELWLDGLKPKTNAEINNIVLSDMASPTHPWNNYKESEKIKRKLSKEEQSSLFVCRKFREMFEKDCLPSWVVHFNSGRVQQLKVSHLKQQIIEEEQKVLESKEWWDSVQKK